LPDLLVSPLRFCPIERYGPEDAKDLTRLSSSSSAEGIHQARGAERGRFRNFLLTVLQRSCVTSLTARQRSRGRRCPAHPLDVAEAEAQYHQAAIADEARTGL